MQFLNKLSVYSAVAVIGVTISFLYYTVGMDDSTAYFVFFTTVYVIAAFRFLLEWRYYRQNRAILASSQFLLLPFVVLLTGSFLTYRINASTLIDFQLHLQSSHLTFIINLVSLSLLLPLIVLHRLFFFYHAKKWLGFAIHRKLFQSRVVPLLVNILFLTIQLFVVIRLGVADGIAAIFILTSFIHIFKYYIFSLFKRSPMQSMDSVLYNSETTHIPTNSNVRIEPRRRSGEIPLLPREGLRTVSARGKNTRTVSTSSKNQRTIANRGKNRRDTSSSHQQEPNHTRRTSTPDIVAVTHQNRKGIAEVAPGREVHAVRSTPNAIQNVSSVLPAGKHLHKADLKCIICFDDISTRDEPIILCPHCKYPSHESEFMAWSVSSNLCARCSKPILKSYFKNPKYRFSAKEYVNKVVSKLD